MNKAERDELTAADLTGCIALPAVGRGPGVLVLHAWWGLTDFFKEFCDRLAGAGFTALAPDLYHGETARTIPEAEQLRDALDGKKARQEVKAALRALRAHPAVLPVGISVIGFSLGANYACTLAREAPHEIKTVVLFYGTGGGLYDKTEARFQGHFAEHDPYETADEVSRMEKRLLQAGREVDFHIYPGVGHWFFESDRPEAYDAAAAELAWQRTTEFLRG